MSSRQYGIQPDNTAYLGQSMSPERTYYDTEPVQLQDYHPPSLQPGVRSPPRRPVAPYERRPVEAQPPSAYYNQHPPAGHRESTTTPDQDAYGMAAAGAGMAGMAVGIADSRPRQSGYEDFRDDYGAFGQDMAPPPPDHGMQAQYERRPVAGMHEPSYSQNSVAGLTSHAAAPAVSAGYYDAGMPRGRSHYHGDGYDDFDPGDIADDGDDGVEEYRSQRQSRFRRSAPAAGTGAGAGAAAAMFGPRDASGSYNPLPGGQRGGGGGGEKSEWLQKQSGGKKKMKWIVGSIIVLVILGAVAGAVVGVLLTRDGSSSGGSSNAPNMDNIDGFLDIDSPQVQNVMGNKNLHKVFPGMDYSPLKTQYPDCLNDPPDQNNVTLDVAVLSQLTPAIRLYGTDCNQTEMVLEGIRRLKMEGDIHIWLGVYLDGNQTTNDRQIKQAWDILDNYPSSHFAGVIVGNEVLFSEYMSLSALGNYVSTFRSNLTAKGINIPVSTADLGDAWTSALARDSDIVMANVHPFFAGVTPDVAPGWTWTFWTTHNKPLATDTSAPYPVNIIAETGWPSEGGNSDGTGTKPSSPTEGAVASIPNLNSFMEGWVCESLTNGTTYFWFEAFDEPWKERFNSAKTGDFWEPHWGLLDVNRNLKKGVTIPDCGGQTVNEPYPQFRG